jgi:hypothetical protein
MHAVVATRILEAAVWDSFLIHSRRAAASEPPLRLHLLHQIILA